MENRQAANAIQRLIETARNEDEKEQSTLDEVMREFVSDGADFGKVRLPIKFLTKVKEMIVAKAVE